MFVRIKYIDLGTEKGYTTAVNSREELIQRLKDRGINAQLIHKLEIKEKGSIKYKEYDPETLKRG
jgi:hypothetical protein